MPSLHVSWDDANKVAVSSWPDTSPPSYHLEQTTLLDPPNWQPLSSLSPAVIQATGSGGFFRLVAGPPP